MNTLVCAALFSLGGAVNTVSLPAGEAVHAGMDNGQPSVCILTAGDGRTDIQARLMSPRPDVTPRHFVMVTQHYEVPDSAMYVGSFTYVDGFIWSVFELRP